MDPARAGITAGSGSQQATREAAWHWARQAGSRQRANCRRVLPGSAKARSTPRHRGQLCGSEGGSAGMSSSHHVPYGSQDWTSKWL